MNRNRMYVVDVIQGNYKPSEMAKMMHDLARKFGLHRIAIEESPGARSMQPVIENHALTTGWPLQITWTEFEEDSGVRDIRVRSIEALIASARLLFSNGVKTKPLLTGFLEYGMMDETGLPDVISRLADNLPVSIANEEDDSDMAYEMMLQNDKYNFVYGRGKYAQIEPSLEEVAAPDPGIEDQQYTESGLEIVIPGLEY
jgi:hypothetical protein